mmetsp:Transcript_34192/g.86486  ORF Transcript_34192/g.86486 Transcript_34192/m.86486 type:complete len:208 (+) Transcript_34192:131-754(+)
MALLTEPPNHKESWSDQGRERKECGWKPARLASTAGHGKILEKILAQDPVRIKGVLLSIHRCCEPLQHLAQVTPEVVPPSVSPVLDTLCHLIGNRITRLISCRHLHVKLHAVAKSFDRIHQHLLLLLCEVALPEGLGQLQHVVGQRRAPLHLLILTFGCQRVLHRPLREEVHALLPDVLEELQVVADALMQVDSDDLWVVLQAHVQL